ncbi:hypothetical protein RRG08_024081 [Elysia crispata]|uniref:Uncharacterized protein n=1 Tax=Elysia crispata TaxID=231223 RepID=A0AAE0ZPZ3_9GAST|nr:hypothetical protein RRG08_024081 [Elysia crispata]
MTLVYSRSESGSHFQRVHLSRHQYTYMLVKPNDRFDNMIRYGSPASQPLSWYPLKYKTDKTRRPRSGMTEQRLVQVGPAERYHATQRV